MINAELEMKTPSLLSGFSSLSLKEIADLNTQNQWSLNEKELIAIQSHFRSLKREPTRAEIETIAQSWSEHCRHKTFKSPIRYQEGSKTTLIKNLFDETIGHATRQTMKRSTRRHFLN